MYLWCIWRLKSIDNFKSINAPLPVKVHCCGKKKVNGNDRLLSRSSWLFSSDKSVYIAQNDYDVVRIDTIADGQQIFHCQWLVPVFVVVVFLSSLVHFSPPSDVSNGHNRSVGVKPGLFGHYYSFRQWRSTTAALRRPHQRLSGSFSSSFLRSATLLWCPSLSLSVSHTTIQ